MRFSELAASRGMTIAEETPLAPLTYFKIGGPAEYFSAPKTNDEFIAVIRFAYEMHVPVTLLGGGANVVIADTGIGGLVIHPENRALVRNGSMVAAGAGVTNGQVLGFTTEEGLSGLENLAGVPGTVGGDIYGNAGMFADGVAPAVHQVLVADAAGNAMRLYKDECSFAYRSSRFKQTHETIIEAVFALTPDEPKNIVQRVRERIDTYKRGKQPMHEPCSGCMFKNPEGNFAARLIDEADLKGKKIGGAMVSDLHANFIVNTGGATADHVLQLVSYIKQQIRDTYHVQLQEEVQFLGFGSTERKTHDIP